MLEYNVTVLPTLEFSLVNSNTNTVSNINNTLTFSRSSSRYKIYESGQDNYDDFVSDDVKHIYKLHINYDLSNRLNPWNKILSKFKLQKRTGKNRVTSNSFDKYSSNIDLVYSYKYYIDFTEFASNLYNNFNVDYVNILNSNDAVLEIYVDSNMNIKYTDNYNIVKIYYDPLSDYYDYFSLGVTDKIPIVKYNLTITNEMPSILYYGITFINGSNNRIVIKGGSINIHNLNFINADPLSSVKIMK